MGQIAGFAAGYSFSDSLLATCRTNNELAANSSLMRAADFNGYCL